MEHELVDVTEVKPCGGYRLFLRFENGVSGVVDVARMVSFDGVFAPLKNRREFVKVRVDPELGTISWPTGADLAPDTLYAALARDSARRPRVGRAVCRRAAAARLRA